MKIEFSIFHLSAKALPCAVEGSLSLDIPIDNRTCMCYHRLMNGREFVRRARRYARKNGLAFDFDPARGKGSHGTVYVGLRQTRVQHGEIRKGTLAAMLKQLEIPREEF